MYLSIYYTFVTLLGMSNLLGLIDRFRSSMNLLSVLFLCPVYLIGMVRIDGVDLDNYRLAYGKISGWGIYDVGFNFLTTLFHKLSIPIEGFLFFLGAYTLIVYWRICKFYRVEFGLVLFILLLHLLIVRDFAQIRVGIAIVTVLYANTFSNIFVRYLGFIVGSTIHFTSIILSGLFLYYDLFLSKRTTTLRLLFPFSL